MFRGRFLYDLYEDCSPTKLIKSIIREENQITREDYKISSYEMVKNTNDSSYPLVKKDPFHDEGSFSEVINFNLDHH